MECQEQQGGEGKGTQEVARADRQRIAAAAAEQGIEAPGEAGQEHQQGTAQRRRAGSGEQQEQQATQGQQETEQRLSAQPFAAQQAGQQQGDLYRAE